MLERVAESIFGCAACVSCHAPAREALCGECIEALTAPEACGRCGRDVCTGCEETWFPFGSIGAAAIYNGSARDLVLAMKRDGKPSAFRLAAQLINWALGEECRDLPVTWVPAGAARKERGFDQGRELARAVAGLLGTRVQRTLSCRSDGRQHARTLDERFDSERFVATGGVRRVPGRGVLLIDDVTTSGASLYYAALALREAGVTEVRAFAFAHTPLASEHPTATRAARPPVR